MTDKQIIIDGVDVSECCHQGKNETCTCPHYKNECTRNPNCHYKIMERQVKKLDKFHKRNLELEQQLKRKEQECERWKSNFNGKVSAIEELLKQLDQLKSEKEELKNAYARLNSLYNDNCNFTGKLEQTLAEIKEILIKTPTDSREHFLNAKSVILQKISECEVENASN